MGSMQHKLVWYRLLCMLVAANQHQTLSKMDILFVQESPGNNVIFVIGSL